MSTSHRVIELTAATDDPEALRFLGLIAVVTDLRERAQTGDPDAVRDLRAAQHALDQAAADAIPN